MMTYSTMDATEGKAAPLRVMIVDDEPIARQRLRRQLSQQDDLMLLGECGDCDTLETLLPSLRPEVLFMDIRMPGIDGMEFARRCLPEPRPLLVFVTAFEEHALDAFEVQAADYLLKPVSESRLAQCLERLRALRAAARRMPAEVVPTASPSKGPPLTRLVVPTGERLLIVPANQVDWVESAGNYAVIHVGRDTHVLRETMAELEQRLGPGQFLRVSRSAIVNLDRVRELRPDEEGRHLMVLADGHKIPITRGLREVQRKLESG